MIKIPKLILKLKEIEEVYPDIPVDVDHIKLHISIAKENDIYLTFTKKDVTLV